MNLKMTSDLVLIRRIVNEQPKSAGGILLPPVEESSDTPWKGEVVAVGPGKPVKLAGAGKDVVDALQALTDAYHSMPNVNWGARGISLSLWQQGIDALAGQDGVTARIPMQVKVGDTVIFSKNLFQEFKIDGEKMIATHEDSILGILESKP